MAQIRTVCLYLLVFFWTPIVCMIVKSSEVLSDECQKKSNSIRAEYQGHNGHIRLKICVCTTVDELRIRIAENIQHCHFAWKEVAFQFNDDIDSLAGHNSSSYRYRCAQSRPLDFDPSLVSTLFICPPTDPLHWNKSIPIEMKQLTSYKEKRSVTDDYALLESQDLTAAMITGLRVEDAEKGVTYDEGAIVVLAGTPVTIRLFGTSISNGSEFRFVLGARERGADCDNLPFTVTAHVDSFTEYSALVSVRLPSPDQISDAKLQTGESPAFYLCSLSRRSGSNHWIHQGREPGVRLRTFQRSLPLWIQICFITVLLTLSGLFSGLNLGLMALDRTELKIYENTGTEKERRYAKAIIPVRNHGNYLLCTLLLGNVLVNSTLTILLDDLTSGIIAIVGSTLGIVIFGEIIPQAICSRFGLAIGAHTVWITKFFMLVTFPLSFPISLILDRILGEEIGAYYNRERLKELIKVTNEYHDLEKDEVNIIAGALELRKKTVGDIMTRLEDVFMLSYDSVLDFETVSEIMKQGFSRIPVYEGERSNIIALLFIKDLAFVDPDDATPLKTLCQFYQNPCNFVFEDTTLDVIFKEFKEGHKGHMAFVQRVNCEGEGDPFYETVGLVTLEDVIEELIQAEIVDETDVWMDNRSKRRREKGKILQDFSSFAHHREQAVQISPQLALAAYQYLNTSIEPFKPEWISESVLRRMMHQGFVIRNIRVKNREVSKSDPNTIIYQQGKAYDYFVLILEGRVEVVIGRENLVFESGPFTQFGTQALTGISVCNIGESPSAVQLFRGSVQSVQAPSTGEVSLSAGGNARPQSFIADYSVRAVTDVIYLRVTRSLYQAARRATLLERAHRDSTQRPGDLEMELDHVFNTANKEEADLLANIPSEVLPLMETVGQGSQRSLNHRTSSTTQDGSWSRNSLSRGNSILNNRQYKESLTSSLPATPSYVFNNSTAQTKKGDMNVPLLISTQGDNIEVCSLPPHLTEISILSNHKLKEESIDSQQDHCLKDLQSPIVPSRPPDDSILSSPDDRTALIHSVSSSGTSS